MCIGLNHKDSQWGLEPAHQTLPGRQQQPVAAAHCCVERMSGQLVAACIEPLCHRPPLPDNESAPKIFEVPTPPTSHVTRPRFWESKADTQFSFLMEETGIVKLTVRDEDGHVNAASVRYNELTSLSNLRVAITFYGLSLEKEFALSYEHPEYKAYLLVRHLFWLHAFKLWFRYILRSLCIFTIRYCQTVARLPTFASGLNYLASRVDLLGGRCHRVAQCGYPGASSRTGAFVTPGAISLLPPALSLVAISLLFPAGEQLITKLGNLFSSLFSKEPKRKRAFDQDNRPAPLAQQLDREDGL